MERWGILILAAIAVGIGLTLLLGPGNGPGDGLLAIVDYRSTSGGMTAWPSST